MQTTIELKMFRRQFLLTPDPNHAIAGWHAHSLRRYAKLFVQPDLAFTQRSTTELEITLLGYVIDPRNPLATDTDILDTMLASAKSAKDVVKLSAVFSGRWVIIAIDAKHGLLVTDPFGLREVHYLTGGKPWCASQLCHIAKPLGLQEDGETKNGFTNSNYVREHPEYFWPGDLTPYREIKHLTPNHALDLDTMQADRFWPDKHVLQKTLDQCVEESIVMLTDLVRGVHHRFPLALPITAGFDSRTILAATRPFAAEVFYYTLKSHAMDDHHRDLVIPENLLRLSGLKHHKLDCPATTSPDFWAVYSKSVFPAHVEAGKLAEGLSRQYPQNHISLSGHGDGVYKSHYYDAPYPHTAVDASLLASKTGMRSAPSAEKAFGLWLEGAQRACLESGFEILDLFFWEGRTGRWAANGQAQWDIVHERFTPFNCRPLLECMLSIRKDDRQTPNCLLQQRMIGALWPDLLKFPFNPKAVTIQENRPSDPSQILLKKVLSRMGLLPTAKRLARAFRKND